jgi:hypothetical protein
VTTKLCWYYTGSLPILITGWACGPVVGIFE